MLESGPAAGVIGTQAIARSLNLQNAIAFDMGGTTAKAGVIFHGQPLTTGSALVGGYEKALPVQIPMMDIFEVGTGGAPSLVSSTERYSSDRRVPVPSQGRHATAAAAAIRRSRTLIWYLVG